MKKKILFIINPVSGIRKQQKKRLPAKIEQYLDQRFYDYSISYSQYEGHATELTREAVENGYDAVVAVGGDGSINEIAKALMGTDAILGIMPFGSGNGLARHLDISLNPKKALQVINRHNVRKIDTAKYAEDRYFFSNVGVGFAADVAKRFANHQVRGLISYAFAVIREFFTYKTTKLRVKLGDKELEREVIIFNIFNSNQFGYGVGLVPWAEVDDGILNIVILNKFPRWRLPLVALLVLLGKQKVISEMEFYEAKKFEVINPGKENWLLQVDGECHDFDRNWEVEVEPLTLNVLAP